MGIDRCIVGSCNHGMSLLSNIKALAAKIKQELAGHAAKVPDLVLEQIARQFPGLNTERLKDGQIPIPAIYLESELVRRTASVKEIESIRLECEPGYFVITLDTKKGPFAHKVRVRLVPEEFALTRDKRVATFLCERDLGIEGRNLLGRVSNWVTQGVIISALQSKTLEQRVSEASQGAVELAWPRIIVHLDRIDRLKPVLEFNVLGLGLTDVLRFGPLRVDKDYAYLRVDMAMRRQDMTPS